MLARGYDAPMPDIDPSEAAAALVAGGVAGPHRSHPRSATVAKIHSMLADDVEARFGIPGIESHSPQQVIDALGELTGCSTDLNDRLGDDTIDPRRTVAAIGASAERLAAEAARGSRLLCVTGHPTGLLEHHIRVLDAYRIAGGKVVTPFESERFAPRAEIRYVGGVGMLCDGARLLHTHSSAPMEALLERSERPDLVLGDHGFAGAAIAAGIPVIAIMDINDPALAVAHADGAAVLVIPMDDNRPPRLYEPSWRIFEGVLGGAPAAAL